MVIAQAPFRDAGGVGVSLKKSIARRKRIWAIGLVLAMGCEAPAMAFDFFGLWRQDAAPPAPSASIIAYTPEFAIEGAGSGLADTLRDASTLYSLRLDAPPDGDSLARRAGRDFAPLVDALWANGYFNADLTISIDGAAVDPRGGSAAFARAAETYRNRALAPVKIKVVAGPRFLLRRIAILGPDGNTPFPEAELPARVIALKSGDPALAEKVRAAEARIVDHFRRLSHPLAKIVAVEPVVDHAADTMDVTIVVDPGPVGRFGDVTVKAPPTIPEAVIRSFIYIQTGEPYSPEAIERTMASVRTIPAVASARFQEKSWLDPHADLPLELDVTDRLPRAFGASAQYSTLDGPEGQVYWEHRNLFGGAEYLRLQADLLYAPASAGSVSDILGRSDLGGRLTAHFVKPALGGSRNDLVVDARVERASTNYGGYVGYLVDDADLSVGLRHRFSDQFSIQAGLEGQRGIASDSLGTINYQLIGVPVALSYDTTNDKLDPSRGLRVSAQFAAYPKAFGSSLNLVTQKSSVAAYRALDESSRFVLAGRLEVGNQAGAALDEIPANLRFYAGGGGSVRGYAYNSLGPQSSPDDVIGGRSLVDGSLELRAKLTDTLGVVPFFDAGDAFASSWPDFSAPLRMSAGLGLRYYTAVGPLRLDLAAPINPRPGDPRYAIYVGIGQSF